MSTSLVHHLLLVSAFSWLITAVVLSNFYGRLRRPLFRLDPHRRFKAVLFTSASPLVVGTGVAAATLLPSLGGLLWVGLDHCPNHHVGHDHLCFVHVPGPLGPEGMFLLAAFVAVVGTFTIQRGLTLLKASRSVKKLVTSTSDGTNVHIIEHDAPFAATVGITAPRVVLSRRLLEVLPPEHLEAVLAHEHAHVRRRDPLWKVVASTLTAPLPPKTRRALLKDLELAAEQSCDQEAAEELGDRLCVAQAILTMERHLAGITAPQCAVTTAFDNAPAVKRVERLLAPKKSPTPIRWDILLILFTAIALVSASSLHHAAESLLGILGR
jgi:hypothetical protein